MSRFVIDVFLNSIVWVNEEELSSNSFRYKIVSNKKLRDIMRDNYNKIYKIIRQNNINGYYHLSTKPLTNILDTSHKGTTYIGNTNLYYHPVGKYVSCGITYFERDKSIHYTYIYQLEFKASVLKINSYNDFILFLNTYKYPDSKIKIHNILDWKRIKTDYDGLIICVDLHNQIFGNTKPLIEIYEDETIIHKNIVEKYGKDWTRHIMLLSEWFRYWRQEGVIWRPSGLKSIRLIDKINITAS